MCPQCAYKKMQSHICGICLTFLHCVFSNASSNRLPERTHSHIGCIFFTFRHCAFSNVSPRRLHKRMSSHIGCICLTRAELTASWNLGRLAFQEMCVEAPDHLGKSTERKERNLGEIRDLESGFRLKVFDPSRSASAHPSPSNSTKISTHQIFPKPQISKSP